MDKKRSHTKMKPLTLREINVILVTGYKKLHERHKKLQDDYMELSLK